MFMGYSVTFQCRYVMDNDQGTVTGVSVAAGRFFLLLFFVLGTFQILPDDCLEIFNLLSSTTAPHCAVQLRKPFLPH